MSEYLQKLSEYVAGHPYLFPIFFVAVWFYATTMLAWMSGWFRLQSNYPDQLEAPIRRWSMASGRMGRLTHYGNCLVLAVCPSGLRVGVWRVFGPFCRDFFVPWRDLRVERLGIGTRLVIGVQSTGDEPMTTLTLSNGLASELAAAAGKSWPEDSAMSAEPSPWGVAQKLLLQWVLISAAASLFFIFGPRLMGAGGPAIPVTQAVLFPTLFFGPASLLQFVVYIAQRPRRAK